MHRYRTLLLGSFMVGAGAYLIFRNPQVFPLWFVWLAGPFLWYAGIAVTIGGIAVALFLSPEAQKATSAVQAPEREEIRVLQFCTIASQCSAPAGVLHEIPAMGGFIY